MILLLQIEQCNTVRKNIEEQAGWKAKQTNTEEVIAQSKRGALTERLGRFVSQCNGS